MTFSIAIIITDFNGFSRTRRCLKALQASIFTNFTVVVVDHGTCNETRDNLVENFPDVIRLTGSSELWWTGATNIGIRYALTSGADAIMLLNNDCYVTPDTIGELVAAWTTNQEAIIAPIQRDWQTGAIVTIVPRSLFLLGFPSMTSRQRLTPDMQKKQLLSTKIIAGGRGALFHASIFLTLGLFDEKYLPHYWADHDFYLRARKKGYLLNVATKAFVDVDSSHTTIADNSGALTFRQWLQSLSSYRSHRNLAHVSELFRRHYPLKHMHLIGVALYTVRYGFLYLLRRTIFLFKNT